MAGMNNKITKFNNAYILIYKRKLQDESFLEEQNI
jgi:hypothetical protein